MGSCATKSFCRHLQLAVRNLDRAIVNLTGAYRRTGSASARDLLAMNIRQLRIIRADTIQLGRNRCRRRRRKRRTPCRSHRSCRCCACC